MVESSTQRFADAFGILYEQDLHSFIEATQPFLWQAAYFFLSSSNHHLARVIVTLIKTLNFTYLVFLIALVANLLAQGSRGLHESTEGRYAEVAREMRLSRNYSVPTLDGNPHWTKPPMTYWILSGGMALIGENAWGARLGGAIASALIAAVLAGVADRLWSRKAAVLAALIWTTGLLPAAGTYTVSTDIYLAAAETFAIAAFIFGWQNQRRYLFILMWLFFALAFLIKGPPGLLPILAIFLFSLRLGIFRRVSHPLGLIVFLGVGSSWYAWAISTYPDLLNYFIGVELVDRVASNNVHNYQWYRAFTLYIPIMFLALGAWSVVALWLLPKQGIRLLVARIRECSPEAFLVACVVLPLAIFCVVKSKLPLYLLPLTAPLTLLTARFLATRLTSLVIRRIAICSFLLIVAMKFAAPWIPHKNDMRQLADMIQPVLNEQTDSAPLLVFRETKLFGLQFYIQQPLIRLTDSGQTSDYPVNMLSIGEYLQDNKAGHLLLSRNRHLQKLTLSLKQNNWTATLLKENAFWSILELHPQTAPFNNLAQQ